MLFLPQTLPHGWYLGWVGHGNLGDEAMYSVAQRLLCNISWEPFDANQLSKELLRHTAGGPFRLGLLGGGTLINTPNDDVLKAYRALVTRTGQVPLFGTGVEDPAVYEGRRGWLNQLPQWAELLSDLNEVGVRGPLSRDLLRASGVNNVRVIGDPALLYSCRHSRSQRDSDSKPRILLNYGAAMGIPMWGSQNGVKTAFTHLLRSLISSGHDVRVVAICRHDVPHCRALLNDAGRSLDPVFLCDEIETYLSCLEKSDVVVAYKLHAGILAIARNLPTIFIEYTPKCRDFVASIGWTEYCVKSDCLQDDVLEALLKDLWKRRGGLLWHVERAIHDLTQAFTSYVERLYDSPPIRLSPRASSTPFTP